MEENAIYQSRVMRRFTEQENRIIQIEKLPEQISEIRTLQLGDHQLWELIAMENRDEHTEIKTQMKINRDEVMGAMGSLKKDLIREFHKSNGVK